MLKVLLHKDYTTVSLETSAMFELCHYIVSMQSYMLPHPLDLMSSCLEKITVFTLQGLYFHSSFATSF